MIRAHTHECQIPGGRQAHIPPHIRAASRPHHIPGAYRADPALTASRPARVDLDDAETGADAYRRDRARVAVALLGLAGWAQGRAGR